MFEDFRNCRAISQRWKYERRLLHTYTKDHLLLMLSHYHDMNYFATGCLAIGANDTGTSHIFATTCSDISSDAIKTISSTIAREAYRKNLYRELDF